MENKLFPLHSTGRMIPWGVAERAYESYSKRYGTGQSLERLAQRGGFSAGELDEFYPGWREEVEEVSLLRAEVQQLQHDLANAQVASGCVRELKEELDRSRAEVERLFQINLSTQKHADGLLEKLHGAERERDGYKAALGRIVTPKPSRECPAYYAEAENLQRIARESLAEAVRLQEPKPAPKIPVHDESAIGA